MHTVGDFEISKIRKKSGFLVLNRKFKPTEYADMIVFFLFLMIEIGCINQFRDVLLNETEKFKAQLFELSQLIHILYKVYSGKRQTLKIC
ncbi:hypothetical protein T05_9174 [Trichinella murrelli]|uniref:Uncharacterized protein n=1 Tax=Trichinella murrelli TaxID=144512 RepID=A0A0V0TBG8_9BILA|nr:hypothetical protein T05_9174 [Trichinella murrelli]